MFAATFDEATTLIAKGDHKHGAEHLYEAIFKAESVDDLRAVERVADEELVKAGWRQKGRYKEIKRVAGKHLEKRGVTVAA